MNQTTYPASAHNNWAVVSPEGPYVTYACRADALAAQARANKGLSGCDFLVMPEVVAISLSKGHRS